MMLKFEQISIILQHETYLISFACYSDVNISRDVFFMGGAGHSVFGFDNVKPKLIFFNVFH